MMRTQTHGLSAIERAYELAKSGRFKNFTMIKKALKNEFCVERELVGRSLSSDITRLCYEMRRKDA